MSKEDNFLDNLEAYLDLTLNDFDKTRILGYLKEYVDGLPIPVIKPAKVSTLPKVAFKYIEKHDIVSNNEGVKAIEPNEIIKLISNLTGVTVEQMKGRIRKFEYVLARHTAMYFINKSCHESTVATGKMFNRDHTSVIHAIQHVRDMSEIKHQKYIVLIDQILTEINQPKEKTA